MSHNTNRRRDDQTVLLLLHNCRRTNVYWAPVAQRLRARADIRIPNLRTQDNMVQMARNTWAVAADVPAGTPAALAASMGGYVAVQMLADAPRAVAALALVDTSSPRQPTTLQSARPPFAELQRDVDAETLAMLRRSLRADRAATPFVDAQALRIMRDVGAETALQVARDHRPRRSPRAAVHAVDADTGAVRALDRVTPLALSQRQRH